MKCVSRIFLYFYFSLYGSLIASSNLMLSFTSSMSSLSSILRYPHQLFGSHTTQNKNMYRPNNFIVSFILGGKIHENEFLLPTEGHGAKSINWVRFDKTKLVSVHM